MAKVTDTGVIQIRLKIDASEGFNFDKLVKEIKRSGWIEDCIWDCDVERGVTPDVGVRKVKLLSIGLE